MSNTEIDSQLDTAIRERAAEIVPESLQPTFEKEVEELIQTARKQIQLKRKLVPDQVIDAENQAIITLQNWSKEKLALFAYSRYKELMEQQGLKFYAFREFRNLNHLPGKAASPQQRFRYLEKNGLTVGSKVKGVAGDAHEGESGVIERIQKDCSLFIPGIHGSLSPHKWVSDDE